MDASISIRFEFSSTRQPVVLVSVRLANNESLGLLSVSISPENQPTRRIHVSEVSHSKTF